ncbi:MAG: phytanoyl-CoA dioxygenase family protein [Chloroflexi bacterium]|nr:phytanoyl-CoA dioxygenase family protein [Chloroflexota bacterium]
MASLDIDSRYPLAGDVVEYFRANGFVHLKNALSPEALAHYGDEITRQVIDLNTLHIPMSERTTYQKAFLQIMNLWRHSDLAREFVFGKRLARIAAELMGVKGVRLYHDQALYKEAGGGFTPWHADQYYWPVSSPNICTAWIPLQETPGNMGPLSYAAGSHRFPYGRDKAISDESEAVIQQALESRHFPYIDDPFDLGDVSFHYGWTFHRADGNVTDRPRRVMTIIYMDAEMRLQAPVNQNQQNDWDTWCPGVSIGEAIDSPLNPVLYSAPA